MISQQNRSKMSSRYPNASLL